jgi:hypothetical protein
LFPAVINNPLGQCRERLHGVGDDRVGVEASAPVQHTN